MSNTVTECMKKIKEACINDPEKVIEMAIKVNPAISDVIADTRKADKSLTSVAAISVRLALSDKNKEVAEMNIICFSTGL